MFRQAFLVVLILLPVALRAQSQFAGKWQTRRGRITLNIVVTDNKTSGTIVLLKPPYAPVAMPISGSVDEGDSFEFETKDKDATYHWRLTLSGKTKGLLDGSVHEMLIVERVRKHNWSFSSSFLG